MNANFTIAFVERQKPREKRYDIRDKLINELILRVESSGKKTYLLDCKKPNGKRTSLKIGDASIVSPSQAREIAKEKLLLVSQGIELRDKDKMTLRKLLDSYYREWAAHNHKNGNTAVGMIEKNFDDFMDRELTDIKKLDIEQWRAKKMNAGVKAATVNRYISALRGAIHWAYNNDLISDYPLATLKKAKETDSQQKIRYLTAEERARLFEAIDEREKELRAARARSRQHSNRRYLQDLSECAFADFFKPLIIVALNTGIRKTALFSLKWEDIDFRTETIALRAETAKSGRSSILPMNKVVFETLKKWHKQSKGEYVFPSPETGGPLDNCKKTWTAVLKAADIKNFRWHDMRHDFASQLVMKGVDLNTVRELMTHSDIKMTLRYAHLAPEKKKSAVDLLCE